MDSHQRIGHICLGKHVRFDIVNLQTGRALQRVYAGTEHIPHRTRGVALTPDESELWISDQVGRKLFIYDATRMPPEPKGEVALSQGGHGWVTFSLDGRYARTHIPDVFDAKTKKLVKDENGKPVSSSKYTRYISAMARWWRSEMSPSCHITLECAVPNVPLLIQKAGHPPECAARLNRIPLP